jgi:hypothetical protein
VLRRLFGLKIDEVKLGWRWLYNEELHKLYSSPSIITMIKSRRMRWQGMQHESNGEKRNAYSLLVIKPERKEPLRRLRRRFVNNIKMDLGKTGWGSIDCIGLAEERDQWRALVNATMNLRVPKNCGKLLSSCIIGGHLCSAQFNTFRQFCMAIKIGD